MIKIKTEQLDGCIDVITKLQPHAENNDQTILSADGNCLKIEGFSFTGSYVGSIDCDNFFPPVAISTKKLSRAIKTNKQSDNLQLSVVDSCLVVAGKRKISIKITRSAVDVPNPVDRVFVGGAHTINLADLAWVAKSMSSDTTRVNIRGVNFSLRSDVVSFNATDTHRLHSSNRFKTYNDDVFLSHQAVKMLLSVKPISACRTDNGLCFDVGDRGRLYFSDGKINFPNIQRLTPHVVNTRHVASKELLTELVLIQRFFADKKQGVKLEFSNNTLAITAKNNDNDSFDVSLLSDGGAPFSTTLNLNYLIDAIRPGTTTVAFGLGNEPEKPVTINRSVLLMPVDKR